MYLSRALNNQPNPVEPEEPPASYFSTKQSRYRSLRRAEDNLPKRPNKKMEFLGSLAKKYTIRIIYQKTRDENTKI